MNEESQAAPSDETTWIQQVEKLAEEVALREGCILYDIEFLAGRVLRISIDKDTVDKHSAPHHALTEVDFDTESGFEELTAGAGIADCSKVAHGLNELVDLDDLVPGGNYNLEVSTPGIDRHLKKLWHFERVIGQKIWVKGREAFETYGVDHAPLKKAKQVEAVLSAVIDGRIILEVSKAQISIPLSAIEKARVVFEMKKDVKKKKR